MTCYSKVFRKITYGGKAMDIFIIPADLLKCGSESIAHGLHARLFFIWLIDTISMVLLRASVSPL